MDKPLPAVTYRISVHEDSVVNDAVFHVESATPLYAPIPGDVLTTTWWGHADLPDHQCYRVTAREHLIEPNAADKPCILNTLSLVVRREHHPWRTPRT